MLRAIPQSLLPWTQTSLASPNAPPAKQRTLRKHAAGRLFIKICQYICKTIGYSRATTLSKEIDHAMCDGALLRAPSEYECQMGHLRSRAMIRAPPDFKMCMASQICIVSRDIGISVRLGGQK